MALHFGQLFAGPRALAGRAPRLEHQLAPHAVEADLLLRLRDRLRVPAYGILMNILTLSLKEKLGSWKGL